MANTQTQITIGSVVLGNTGDLVAGRHEVPSRVTGLGATMELTEHVYPGGTRQVQTHGAQPYAISWSANLYGPTAMSRCLTLKRLVTNEQVVTFSWGPFKYDVVVSQFHPTIYHDKRVSYSITLTPVKDRSAPSVVATIPADSSSQVTMVLQNLNTSLQTSPLPSSVTGVASTPFQGAASTASGVLAGSPLSVTPSSNPPSGLLGVLTKIVQDMAGNQWQVANLPTGTVSDDQTAIGGQITTLAPFLLNSDHGVSSSARVLTSQLGLLSGLLGNPTRLLTQITVSNPNLVMLAATYLGDQSLWPSIASANGLAADPFPTGLFHLLIPQAATP